MGVPPPPPEAGARPLINLKTACKPFVMCKKTENTTSFRCFDLFYYGVVDLLIGVVIGICEIGQWDYSKSTITSDIARKMVESYTKQRKNFGTLRVLE